VKWRERRKHQYNVSVAINSGENVYQWRRNENNGVQWRKAAAKKIINM